MKALMMAIPIILSGLAADASELETKISPHSVDETVARLSAAIEKAGAKVFAQVDHSGGAQSVGLELAPTKLVIFGNPKVGTLVMQADPAAGLDLPLRVIVYQAADGKTHLAYRPAAQFATDHAVPADLPVLGKISGALDKLTSAAIAE